PIIPTWASWNRAPGRLVELWVVQSVTEAVGALPGVRGTTTMVSAARERLEKVLVNEPGHRLAQHLAGRDIETEMIPAPDNAVLRLGRGDRETGERVRDALQVL